MFLLVSSTASKLDAWLITHTHTANLEYSDGSDWLPINDLRTGWIKTIKHINNEHPSIHH